MCPLQMAHLGCVLQVGIDVFFPRAEKIVPEDSGVNGFCYFETLWKRLLPFGILVQVHESCIKFAVDSHRNSRSSPHAGRRKRMGETGRTLC